jgi:uncharacterized protein YjbI with pentapeptide repeats
MADQWHLITLQRGVKAWNSWRERNPSIEPDLSVVDFDQAYDVSTTDMKLNLSGLNLSRADLSGAYFSGMDLSGANLSGAKLSWADLSEVDLSWWKKFGRHDFKLARIRSRVADPSEVDFYSVVDLDKPGFGFRYYKANLSRANLSRADLSGADLSGADLSDANLTRSVLVKTNLQGATLEGCSIYGISAWNLKLEGTKQQNLNVSGYGEPAIRVDNLEVAQFIYLLLNNERIRQVIDTITSKVVLILGRFASERKAVLEAIRDSLRQRDYLPVLFDFEKPASRNITETVSTLAHMARFVIADITDAKSIPQELQRIVPDLPSVPVQPLLLASDYEYGMFEDFKYYPWVLEVYRYEDSHELLTSLEAKVISPAEAKARELSA